MHTNILKDKKEILMVSVALGLFVSFLFILLEPTLGRATTGTEDQFTITQLVTSEISFSTHAANITMVGALAGITGGTSNGQTQVVVTTNNATGYNMTLIASSSAGMLRNGSGDTIPAYIPATTNVPDFTFTTPANTARFGYTVEASSTPELATAFKNTGSTCNTGTADAVDSCWINASTTAFTIINSSGPTSGSTTTLKFRVVINASPSPQIPAGTYVATSTLTVTTN